MLTPSEDTCIAVDGEAQAREHAALLARNAELERQITAQRLQIEHLQWKLQDLLRRLFGPKS